MTGIARILNRDFCALLGDCSRYEIFSIDSNTISMKRVRPVMDAAYELETAGKSGPLWALGEGLLEVVC